MEITERAYKNTQTFIGKMPKEQRKKYGQFFTTPSIADFMANMYCFDLNKNTLSILDAGAGSGILSVALIANLREKGFEGIINITCYENDCFVIPILEQNLLEAKEKYQFEYVIIVDNYITSQQFESKDSKNIFDLIIGNPPYKKILKGAIEAISMPDVCHGAPNLYFLFWTMGICNLKPEGEMVYIVPRSWTSGAYFEYFRRYLFNNAVIEHVHLFGSRDKVFDGDAVLQETIIVKIKKTTKKPRKVKVTFSKTSDFSDTSCYRTNYNSIVSSNGYVHLITNKEEENVLNKLNIFSNTLISDGLRMKTGIVVDFRTREVLRNEPSGTTYPLLYAQHIKNGLVKWPIGKESEYICTEKSGLLQENTNYLIVKRFTSKEEKRRLQSGIYLKIYHPEFKYISTQNKVNYIKCNTPELAYGLFVIMNSTIYDVYYRILNGSTQVNSTEMNRIPVPDTQTICEMGKELMRMELSEKNCDKILDKWIKN